jgi:hypothetical protein
LFGFYSSSGTKEFIFTMDSEIDVVAENGKKTHGGVTLTPFIMNPIKVEYGARVSDEFLYASEEAKINMLKDFNQSFARKVAKGLDLMAFHGVNPRTGNASDVIGENHFDAKVTQEVKWSEEDPEAALEAAAAMVDGSDADITGIAMSKIFSNALAKVRVNGVKQFPEFSIGANPGSFNGIRTDVNRTVSDKSAKKDILIMGDFENMFRWGYTKEVPLEIIKYGDPDNSGNDLRGYNQVYLRSELFLGWGIIEPKAFARIVQGEIAGA